MRIVALKDIRIDGGTQCRISLDKNKINDYADDMKNGDEFPVLMAVFDTKDYWLTDGFHRWHAYKKLGIKEVKVEWKPGTREDAILEALKANSKHGLPLTVEDKRNKVRMALELPGYDTKTNYEIAKLCDLSAPFVASERDPKIKERQKENRDRNIQKKAQEMAGAKETTQPVGNSNRITIPHSQSGLSEGEQSGSVPDDEELQASEVAEKANEDLMYALLESSEPLKVAHAEIQRLNLLNAKLELRIKGLMNEKNEAIKMVKQLEAKLKKAEK